MSRALALWQGQTLVNRVLNRYAPRPIPRMLHVDTLRMLNAAEQDEVMRSGVVKLAEYVALRSVLMERVLDEMGLERPFTRVPLTGFARVYLGEHDPR